MLPLPRGDRDLRCLEPFGVGHLTNPEVGMAGHLMLPEEELRPAGNLEIESSSPHYKVTKWMLHSA